MTNASRRQFPLPPLVLCIYIVLMLACAVFMLISLLCKELTGTAFGLLALIALFACRPGSALHKLTLEKFKWPKAICAALVALCTISASTSYMDKLPLWNGEIPGHRNQYELMAENLLEGRLHFAYGDEDTLADLENPYDPDERKEAGVYYHWDHAYYNGQYYMYFGIVPVFLAFLPHRILTGTALPTYQATQLFTGVFIAGIFALFWLLSRRFFPKLPFGVYLAMSTAVSVMSVWYAAAEPALYCTAITAALALQIWSIYFFVKAVWCEERENLQLLLAGIGALLGALVFGCRPPIALANILVIPMLAAFLKQRKFSVRLLGKLALAAAPYALVALGLMLYNNARFDNPFEFGQKYQLTVADQSQYGITLDAATLVRVCNDLSAQLLGRAVISEDFPYLSHGGAFFNFPMLVLIAAFLHRGVRQKLREYRLSGFAIGLLVTVAVITVMDILWTPYLLERYRMDIYFLLGIACFLAVGLWHSASREKTANRLSFCMLLLSAATIVRSVLFFVKTVSVYYPAKVEELEKVLFFWK